MGFLSDGKIVEKKFSELFSKTKTSSDSQDMNEHWDLEVSFKIDVKSVKKLRRSDPFPNENYHYVEIKNVHGKDGWLYGDADYFAFETFDDWIMVDKLKLQEFIVEKVNKIYVDSPDKSLYCLYRRSGRKDTMTLVKSLDLVKISDSIMPKTENEHFESGESVIPEERAKNRLKDILK